jgi:hypothetical protein
MALPEEDVDSYLARRAKPGESWVSLKHTPVSQPNHSFRPFQLGNLPSLLSDRKVAADAPSDPSPVDGPSRNPPVDFRGDAADLVAPQPPRTPVKASTIEVSDEPAPAVSSSRRDLSPRRIVLTRPKRVVPPPKPTQSSPIDATSPVASSTPAKPPTGKIVDESPLLGKRRRDGEDASPAKPAKHKPKGKGKAVDLAPEHTSPIQSPRFDTSTLARTSKRPRESIEGPGSPLKRKNPRTGVVPTSPINSAEFPPNTEQPPILNRQGSLTISSHQLLKRPRDNRVIKSRSMLPPPTEVSVEDTSVIESFDVSPLKPPITTKQTDSKGDEKKPQGPAEVSFLTSPGTSPKKPSPFLPPPPKVPQRAQVKNTVVDSPVASLTSSESSREGLPPNSKGVTGLNPLPSGQTAKTMGITKLRPAATTILPTGAGPSKLSSTATTIRSRSTLGQAQAKKNPIIPTKKGKDKPVKMTPVEYAEMLIERYNNPNRKIPNVSQHLRGRTIFYVGLDRRSAGDETKKKMEYVRTFHSSTLTPAAHSPIPDSQAWGHACP